MRNRGRGRRVGRSLLASEAFVIASASILAVSEQLSFTTNRPGTGTGGTWVGVGSVTGSLTLSFDSQTGPTSYSFLGATFAAGETVTLSYTPGDFVGNNGVKMAKFTDMKIIVL